MSYDDAPGTLVRASAAGSDRIARVVSPGRVVVSLPPTSITNLSGRWSLPAVDDALCLHEEGDFSESARLAMSFARDARIKGCMGIRTRTLIGLPFVIEPNPDATNKRLSKAIAKEMRGWWKRCCSEGTVRGLARDYISLGVAIGQILWASEGGKWIPTVKRWPMEYAHWNSVAMTYEVLTLTGWVPIERGTGQWIIWESEAERSWLEGDVIALGPCFSLRRMDWRDWARFNERHGLPILKIYEPSKADPEVARRFYERVRNMGRSGSVRLPRGVSGGAQTQNNVSNDFDVDLLEAKDGSWKSFQAFKGDIDADVAILLLGGNLNAEVSGGSLAAARQQGEVKHDLVESDADAWNPTIDQDLIRPYCWLNYGDAGLQAAPLAGYLTEEPEDELAQAQTLDTRADALVKLKNAGVDITPLVEQMGLRMAATVPAGALGTGAEGSEAANGTARPAGRTRGVAASVRHAGLQKLSALRKARLSSLSGHVARLESYA